MIHVARGKPAPLRKLYLVRLGDGVGVAVPRAMAVDVNAVGVGVGCYRTVVALLEADVHPLGKLSAGGLEIDFPYRHPEVDGTTVRFVSRGPILPPTLPEVYVKGAPAFSVWRS